jgi:uncharacterized double-CXXCG motif protein
MRRFFLLDEDRAAAAKYGGYFKAWHEWLLPGVRCPVCGATWAETGHHYPCVDLSQLPEWGEFVKARPEPLAEFLRLRELVRPLAPPNAGLPPGTGFGPLVGRAFGELGPISWVGGQKLLMRREVLERLQAEGVRGLVPCPTELRFRQKDPPELLELQVEPHGQLHTDCIPPDAPHCSTCGRHAFKWPDEPILDVASLPTDRDLFRLGNFATMIIGTERFMDAVRRLELDGIFFRELPTR